jgi:hypothetical protein
VGTWLLSCRYGGTAKLKNETAVGGEAAQDEGPEASDAEFGSARSGGLSEVWTSPPLPHVAKAADAWTPQLRSGQACLHRAATRKVEDGGRSGCEIRRSATTLQTPWPAMPS